MAMSVVTRPPRRLEPVSNSGEPLPDALASIVYRCLEKSPAKRFQTMQELDTALSLFGSDGDGDEISTELDIREFESSAPKRRPSLSPPHISHRVLTPQLNRVVTQRHPRAHRALIAAGLIAALATGFAVLKLQRLWVESQAQLAPSARPPRAPPR